MTAIIGTRRKSQCPEPRNRSFGLAIASRVLFGVMTDHAVQTERRRCQPQHRHYPTREIGHC